MKTLIVILSFSFTTNIPAQSTDSLGIDNSITLNRQEIHFLNNALQNSRGSFDFSNKKIAFVTGSTGSKLIAKQDYFLKNVKPWTDKGELPQLSFVQLTDEEKLKSNGYDGILLSFVKVFSSKQRKKIIAQLSKK